MTGKEEGVGHKPGTDVTGKEEVGHKPGTDMTGKEEGVGHKPGTDVTGKEGVGGTDMTALIPTLLCQLKMMWG